MAKLSRDLIWLVSFYLPYQQRKLLISNSNGKYYLQAFIQARYDVSNEQLSNEMAVATKLADSAEHGWSLVQAKYGIVTGDFVDNKQLSDEMATIFALVNPNDQSWSPIRAKLITVRHKYFNNNQITCRLLARHGSVKSILASDKCLNDWDCFWIARRGLAVEMIQQIVSDDGVLRLRQVYYSSLHILYEFSSDQDKVGKLIESFVPELSRVLTPGKLIIPDLNSKKFDTATLISRKLLANQNDRLSFLLHPCKWGGDKLLLKIINQAKVDWPKLPSNDHFLIIAINFIVDLNAEAGLQHYLREYKNEHQKIVNAVLKAVLKNGNFSMLSVLFNCPNGSRCFIDDGNVSDSIFGSLFVRFLLHDLILQLSPKEMVLQHGWILECREW